MINNLNYYNVFYMVAKTGSISRAANQLYISQPAVSKAISNLEESIGIALFVRNSRGVALTEEGTILYDYIERALDNIVKGEESLKKYNELGIGHIRIGVSTSLCKHILLDYLKPFIKDNPNIKVSIDCHLTDDVMPGVVCLPHGYGHARADGIRLEHAKTLAGVSFNELSDPQRTEAITGNAILNGIPVGVSRAD